MMFEIKKIKLLLFLMLAWICMSSGEDSKILRKFSVGIQNNSHDATISLDDQGNLIFEGMIVQMLDIPHDPDHILKLRLEYVANKSGYKPKYVLTREEFVQIKRLNPTTLKSLAG